MDEHSETTDEAEQNAAGDKVIHKAPCESVLAACSQQIETQLEFRRVTSISVNGFCSYRDGLERALETSSLEIILFTGLLTPGYSILTAVAGGGYFTQMSPLITTAIWVFLRILIEIEDNNQQKTMR